MRHKRFALVALAGAAAGASAANAQLAPNQMVQGRVARAVQASAAASVDYDSNAARTSAALAAQQGIRPEDITYTSSLSANIVLPVGRQALFLAGTVGYSGHQYNPELNNVHADVTAGAGASVGPCGSVLTAGYSRGQSRYDNTVLSTNVEDIQQVKRINLGVTCARSAGLGVFADASKSWATNSIKLAANGDYETTTVSGGVSYQRPSFGSISLTASDAKTDYSKDGLGVLLVGSSGFEAKSGGVSLERRLGGRIQASLAVSYTKVETENPVPVGSTIPAAQEFSGPTYSGDVSFRASSRLQAHAGFSRSVNPSQITGGSFELDTEYQVGLSYNLGTRIKLGITGRDRETTVHGAIPVFLAATTLTEGRSKSVEVSADYRLTKRLSLVLTARHEMRNANNPLFDYGDDAVGLSASVRF